MPEDLEDTWPRNWEGTIVWERVNPDGGSTSMFWSVPEQTWKPMNRFDVLMYSGYATEEELIANPQDFK